MGVNTEDMPSIKTSVSGQSSENLVKIKRGNLKSKKQGPKPIIVVAKTRKVTPKVR